ncbi:hypothetical protein ACIODS_11240 [Micromonospora chalcea]|uniref:hypothetical protein n=1 Tax=Micromonospora chalcea TaxID=1874 RepID=UPI00380373FD
MTVDLFAGVPIRDLAVSTAWYERLFGAPPQFRPNHSEAVWELAEHRYLYVDVRPEHAGHAMQTVFVEDFDSRVAAIAATRSGAGCAGDLRQRRPEGDLPRSGRQRDRLRRRPRLTGPRRSAARP